ncbi:unnamed protein product [Allacma fusca]|uniref:Aquaporin n=1 Tax=Allacma fusca TaxID=39272 RepID=A0A8J2L1R5_9HEXA|nr:unnamed protein product [Allacma fusca]
MGKGKSFVTPLCAIARRKFRIRNEFIREAMSECLGDTLVGTYAVGGAIQHFLQPGNDSIQPIFGALFGLMTAILISGGASGAHLNPAVTFGLALAGEISWLKVPLYWLAQILGAYFGAGIAVATYSWVAEQNGSSFSNFYPASVFSPVVDTPFANGILDQVVTTSILMLAVMAVIDQRNMGVPKHMIAFFFCLIVSGIAMCYGYNAGAVINPARDLGPRLMALTVGYSVDQIFTANGSHWWMVGIVGPIIGAVIGTIMYILLIGSHLDDLDEELEDGNVTKSNDNNINYYNNGFRKQRPEEFTQNIVTLNPPQENLPQFQQHKHPRNNQDFQIHARVEGDSSCDRKTNETAHEAKLKFGIRIVLRV